MLAAEVLGYTKGKRKSRALLIAVTIKTPAGLRVVQCLIDSGAEANFVSQSLVKDLQLPEDEKVAGEWVEAIDGHSIRSYNRHTLDLNVGDSEGASEDLECEFYAVDMRGYDMILGYPWLDAINPDIIWHTKTWYYRKDHGTQRRVPISICSAEEFAQLAMAAQKGDGEAYVALPYELLVGEIKPRRGFRRPVRCGALEVDEPELPDPINDLMEAFSEIASDSLNTHDQVEHPIDLVDDRIPKSGPIYNMSQDELATIREYLESAQRKKWIRPSTAQCGAPVLFVKKPDGGLRLCVDYRSLNELTVKNNYPLPLLSETLERFAHAKHFTKIDIRNAYHRIRIRKGDEWKTSFRTRYGQFEYQVMPFGLANAPATFQSYVNKALKPYIDVFCVVYLDDVLIYSTNEKEHWKHVRLVLKALLAHRLYAKLSKCAFNRSEVTFLGFVVGKDGIKMEQSRIDAISEWPIPECAKDILVFLGFAGFYRRFVRGFSQIAAPLTDLTKGAKKGVAKAKFVWSIEAQEAFDELKRTFTSAPVLVHFDWESETRMETDSSGRGAGGVLSQKGSDGQWHPIAYFSYKFKGPEERWDTHDKELYAIVLGFKNWRHYLQGSKHTVRVITDHNNLRYFMTTKELNAKQVRWAEKLAAFDFTIEYRKGTLNPADAPSRRPDIMKPEGTEDSNEAFLPTLRNKLRNREYQPEILMDPRVPAAVKLAASTTQLGSMSTADTSATGWDERVLARRHGVLEAAASRLLVHQVMESERSYLELREPMVAWLLKLQQRDAFVAKQEWRQKYATNEKLLSQWNIGEDGLLRKGLAVYVPKDSATREEILRTNHDDPGAGHFARSRTMAAIRKKYYWDSMGKDIEEYCKSCPVCQRVRVHHHKPYGNLSSIAPGGVEPFTTVTLDFITDMPPARDPYTGKTYDSILVLVDKLTKHATYIACNKTLDAKGLADLLWREFVCHHGMMKELISDRGSLFTSHFWSTLCWHLGAKRKLSTAFHPQTDGQTERQNQVLEHYLRVYCNYTQDNWPELLPMAAFAYNNSVHASTQKAPNELLSGYIATLGSGPEDRPLRGEAPLAVERAEWLQQTRKNLMDLWKSVAEQQAKYYNKRHENKTFLLGEKVLLRSLNIRTLRPKKKIDHRQLGPFTIIEKIGTQAYRLDLPEKYGAIHNVFHVSLLEPWHSRDGEDPEPQPILVEGEEEWEVSQVLDKRIKKGEVEYLIEWVDSPPYENSWEPMEHLENAQEAIDNFEHAREQRRPAAKRKKAAARTKRDTAKSQAQAKGADKQSGESQAGKRKRGRPRKN